ncbi:oxidoreductase [Bacillus mangrovi]|uniref:Oxidoreductase n=1 Tax=Metabacillus mangrovi TaxID=1491830 RepID=A0A7X2S3Q9_9BACI|nr:oxidoreductase [Metabacillus mangrovi]MTH53139.1 oxidoreductase [Metabacillus mangrovi]
MEKIRTGLVGFGLSGQVFHAPFLHVHPGFELTKVAERSQNLAKTAYPYIQRVRSYEELLEDESIELVIITTPNEFHYPMIKDALYKGKHVIVEKPFTIASAEGYELQELAKERSLLLSVYHNRRWDGDFMTVQSIVNQELLGNVHSYEAHFDRFETEVNSDQWREKAQPGAGIVYDLGSHLIDQALTLFGQPYEISADIWVQREGGHTDDAFSIRLHYPGLTAELKSGVLVREPGPRYLVHGSRGSFVKYGIDPQEGRLKLGALPTDLTGTEEEKEWGILNTEMSGLHYKGRVETIPGQYMAYYDQFYKAVREGGDVPVTADSAARVIKVIECAKMSAEEKRSVPFF